MKTLQELESTNVEFLNVADIAPLLDMDPQNIRSQAQADPQKLGFPVIVTGSRIRIPRLGFIHFWKYGYAYKSES